MELHEAIVEVLKEANKPLTYSEIANRINQRRLYTPTNGEMLMSRQISARVAHNLGLFKKDKTYRPMLISLRTQ